MTYAINEEHKAIVSGKTGKMCYPSCFADLTLYHAYLTGKGQEDKAQNLLKEVFKGERVIAKMIKNLHRIE